MVRAAGFETTVLVTEEYDAVLRGLLPEPDPHGDGFHVDTLLEHARPNDLEVVADRAQSRLMGFEPCYHFATWECLRPDCNWGLTAAATNSRAAEAVAEAEGDHRQAEFDRLAAVAGDRTLPDARLVLHRHLHERDAQLRDEQHHLEAERETRSTRSGVRADRPPSG